MFPSFMYDIIFYNSSHMMQLLLATTHEHGVILDYK